MGTKTIPELPAAPNPLDGTEPVEIVQGGVSVKTTVGAIAALAGGGGADPAAVAPPASVTTVTTSNLAPTDIDPTTDRFVEVTTDGSGLLQTLNIPNIDLPGSGNYQWIGRRIIIYLDTLTNGSDVLQVTCGGHPGFPVQPGYTMRNAGMQYTWYDDVGGGAKMANEKTTVCVTWNGASWQWEIAQDHGGGNRRVLNSTKFASYDIVISTVPAPANYYNSGNVVIVTGDAVYGSVGNITATGGNASTASYNGGSVKLIGGNGTVAGAYGGFITVKTGEGRTLTGGYAINPNQILMTGSGSGMSITAGTTGGPGSFASGQSITITAGNTNDTAEDGGSIYFNAGATGTQYGASAAFRGGSPATPYGGQVRIVGGSGSTATVIAGADKVPGSIVVTTGANAGPNTHDGGFVVDLTNTGVGNPLFVTNSLPTSSSGVSKSLYTASAVVKETP